MPAFITTARAEVERALPEIRVIAFGHIGDGNVHFNLCQPKGADREAFLKRWPEFNRIVHDVVMTFRGSISAEHGIGQLKRDELQHYKSSTDIALMRALKQTLDPKGIMNPGKVI
jgi:FAD/FMN-containing dehydrogenase